MGAEAVWPEAVVAVAVTSYVMPGARPVRLQSYGTEQVTTIGEPPPRGSALIVYGPLLPTGCEKVTLILIGLVAWAMTGV